MTLLYETVFKPKVKVYRRRAYQVTEAPYWRIVQEYQVNSIYMTQNDMITRIRDEIYKAAADKGLTVTWWNVTKMWAVWKVLYTEYHAEVEYVLKGSPVAQAVILAVIGIIELALILAIIYLVATTIIQPLFEPYSPAPGWPALPKVAYGAIFIGGAILIGGVGYYLIKKPKK